MSTSTAVENQQTTKLQPPSRYVVVLLNDDYTPMDFVVNVLKIFFNKTTDQAIQIMLEVHYNGKGICGTYTKDIATTKVSQVNHFSREHQHPLLCMMEKA